MREILEDGSCSRLKAEGKQSLCLVGWWGKLQAMIRSKNREDLPSSKQTVECK